LGRSAGWNVSQTRPDESSQNIKLTGGHIAYQPQ
jgi:hypothetical protein